MSYNIPHEFKDLAVEIPQDMPEFDKMLIRRILCKEAADRWHNGTFKGCGHMLYLRANGSVGWDSKVDHYLRNKDSRIYASLTLTPHTYVLEKLGYKLDSKGLLNYNDEKVMQYVKQLR